MFYYLPQLSETNIESTGNYQVRISIPSLSSFGNLGAIYIIYYKIYMSSFETLTQLVTEFSSINGTLDDDYSALWPYVNPANTTSVTDIKTFRNRDYHELHFEGSNIVSGGDAVFSIVFPSRPGDIPYISSSKIDPITGDPFRRNLFRAGDDTDNNGIIFKQEPDRYFFFSNDLIGKTDHANFINNDVNLRGPSAEPIRTDRFAYVSMYIVAAGSDPVSFVRVFGKPTHIGVYRLTNLF